MCCSFLASHETRFIVHCLSATQDHGPLQRRVVETDQSTSATPRAGARKSQEEHSLSDASKRRKSRVSDLSCGCCLHDIMHLWRGLCVTPELLQRPIPLIPGIACACMVNYIRIWYMPHNLHVYIQLLLPTLYMYMYVTSL